MDTLIRKIIERGYKIAGTKRIELLEKSNMIGEIENDIT